MAKYHEVLLTDDEILKLLYLLYGSKASVEVLTSWANIWGGLPKHLMEHLGEGGA